MFGRVAEGGVRVVDYDQGGNESDSAFRIRVPPGCSEMRSYIRTLVPSYAFAFKRPSLLVSHQSRVGNSQFAIRNSQWTWSVVPWSVVSRHVVGRLTFHFSRFTLCGVIPHSAMSLPLLPCSRAQRCSPAAFPLPSADCLLSCRRFTLHASRFTFSGIIPHSNGTLNLAP